MRFGDRQTDGLTDKQMDSPNALSRLRYREAALPLTFNLHLYLLH